MFTPRISIQNMQVELANTTQAWQIHTHLMDEMEQYQYKSILLSHFSEQGNANKYWQLCEEGN